MTLIRSSLSPPSFVVAGGVVSGLFVEETSGGRAAGVNASSGLAGVVVGVEVPNGAVIGVVVVKGETGGRAGGGVAAKGFVVVVVVVAEVPNGLDVGVVVPSARFGATAAKALGVVGVGAAKGLGLDCLSPPKGVVMKGVVVGPVTLPNAACVVLFGEPNGLVARGAVPNGVGAGGAAAAKGFVVAVEVVPNGFVAACAVVVAIGAVLPNGVAAARAGTGAPNGFVAREDCVANGEVVVVVVGGPKGDGPCAANGLGGVL